MADNDSDDFSDAMRRDAVLVLGDSNFGKFEVEKELKASGHALK